MVRGRSGEDGRDEGEEGEDGETGSRGSSSGAGSSVVGAAFSVVRSGGGDVGGGEEDMVRCGRVFCCGRKGGSFDKRVLLE